MRIIKDTSRQSNADPLIINFLLKKDEYKPYARKILSLNNDPYIGRRIFNIDVVDISEFETLPLDGANVVVRLASDPDEETSFLVETFDYTLPKKKLLSILKEFIIDLYKTDLSLAKEVLKKYEDRRDEKGCETFSKLIELLNVTRPRDYNLLLAVGCHRSDSSIPKCEKWQPKDALKDGDRLYEWHPLSGLSDEDRRIRRAKNALQTKMAESKNFGQELTHLLKLLDERYGPISISKSGKTDEADDSSSEKEKSIFPPEDVVPESDDYLIQIIPYKYNYTETCDFYLQANGIGSVLRVRTGLGAFVYAMCLILRKHKAVLWRKTLLKDIPADKDKMTPEQKWMESLYKMLFSNNQVKNFREWWKSQIGWDKPECHGLNVAITQLKGKLNKLISDNDLHYFTIQTVKDHKNKRKVAHYWIDMPKDNIVFEGSKFNELIRNIPESLLEGSQEGIAE